MRKRIMIINKKFHFFDLLRLFKALYPLRIFNYLGIVISYYLSKLLGRTVLLSSPFSLTFEVSSICNLRCPQCLTGRKETMRNNDFINKIFVDTVLKKFRNRAFYVNFYMQGEPLLNKELASLIIYAKKLNYYTYLSTNGMLLTEETAMSLINSGLDKIVISIDGTRQSSYSYYRRGGDLENVKEGVKNIAHARKIAGTKNPVIIMQFLVHKKNEDEISELYDFAQKLGFDKLQLKSMQIYDNADSFIPDNSLYNRYSGSSNEIASKKGCFRLWSHAVFNSDGVLVPCCYDKKPEHTIVAAGEESWNLWNSKQFNDFRKKVLLNKAEVDICNNCGE